MNQSIKVKSGDVVNLAGDIACIHSDGIMRAVTIGFVFVTTEQYHVARWFGWVAAQNDGPSAGLVRLWRSDKMRTLSMAVQFEGRKEQ